jgi:hypothetical protein
MTSSTGCWGFRRNRERRWRLLHGAGSVVMTNIPPHSLAMGNPARVTERGINTTIFGIRQEAYDLRFEEAQRRKAASA